MSNRSLERFSPVEIDLDVEKSKDELIKIAKRMTSEHPDVGASVLECTNMTPFAAAIHKVNH